jgi:hypothetical protein
MEFQVKHIVNLISKYHTTEDRPPKTVPPIRMSAPHYPSYIAATVSKHNLCQHGIMCYKKRCHEAR